jgi:hypothetical protein
MIISFIEHDHLLHRRGAIHPRPINVHVLFSPDKPEKLQKIARSRSKNFGEIA